MRRELPHTVLIVCLLLGALVLRLESITKPSLESRELHNALVARQLYLGDGDGLPEWKRRVLDELGEVAQPIEPPLLDALAAAGYRVAGGERLWIPRLASSLAWIIGGVFLYLMALRLTGREGALVALAAFLYWPYAVWLSRLYMPDATMIACLLGATLAVVRYWESPTAQRLVVAGAAASVASLVKPGVALVFIVAVFVAIAVSLRVFRDVVITGRLALFCAMALLLPAMYVVYGSYVAGFLGDETSGRVQPWLVATQSFWTGWWQMVSTVLVFPQPQRDLAVVVLAVASVGFGLAPKGLPRGLLAGLGVGYVTYALLVPGFTSTHAYYALPLLPLLALATGCVAGRVVARARAEGPRVVVPIAACAVLLLGIAAYKGEAVLRAQPPAQAIADYRRIGKLTRHSPHAIVVDERLRSPLSYWGWMVARYWYPPTPGIDLPSSGDLFPSWIDPNRAEFLVVVEVQELATEPRLREYVRSLPVTAREPRFVVFDLRTRA